MSQSPPSDHDHHAFISSAKLIAAWTMVSRVLGLVRDIVFAVYFGAGLVASAFVTAWTVPNLFRRLFGEGAAASAFVPAFTTSIRTRPREETQRLYSVTFTALALLLIALTLLIEGVVLGLRCWGTFDAKTTLVLDYTALLMPYMLLICLTAFFMAVLNAHRHFFAPAMMPVILNVVWIVAAYVVVRLTGSLERAGTWLAVAILVGGGLQLLSQVPFAMRLGVRLRPSLEFSHPGFRQIVTLLVPVVLGSAAVQLNALADRVIAYYLVAEAGAASFLVYGHHLVQFPLSLVGVAISTAVLTPLSEQAALGRLETFKKTLMSALRLTLFLMIPAGIGLMVLAEPTVEIIFRHGKFAANRIATSRTAWVLFCYGIGVWADTSIYVILRGFYALKDTRTPPRVATLMVLINLALNLTLVWFLDEAGLALATSACAMLQFVLLFAVLRRRMGPLGGREVWRASLKTLAVSVVMGLVAGGGWYFFWPAQAGVTVRVLVLAALVVGSCGLFVAGAWLLKMPELGQLLRRRRGAGNDE